MEILNIYSSKMTTEKEIDYELIVKFVDFLNCDDLQNECANLDLKPV